MTVVWTAMAAAAVLFGTATGNASAVGAAAVEGAAAAVSLGLRMLGGVMFWSGLMEVMSRAGLTERLSALLRPLLRALFPSSREDGALTEALSVNLGANLLGLGNAATPAGVRAAWLLCGHTGGDTASDELCRLVVMNTASVQLLPVTVAAMRAGLGAQNAFDILPAVWLASLLSVTAGLLAERVFSRLW